jgi:hypothetical protein
VVEHLASKQFKLQYHQKKKKKLFQSGRRLKTSWQPLGQTGWGKIREETGSRERNKWVWMVTSCKRNEGLTEDGLQGVASLYWVVLRPGSLSPVLEIGSLPGQG